MYPGMEGYERMHSKPYGWVWFGVWAIIGIVGALAILSAMSVGLFLIPVAGIGAWVVAKRARVWPEVLGLMFGAAAVLLAIAYRASSTPQCDDPRPPFPSPGPVGELQTYTCIDLSPVPFLFVGVVLALLGLGAYVLVRRVMRV